ncbi:hypothetical protein [[Clostridium] fimetarium]|uniref:Cohesin domain-containing protein n=1 Tax=[Clostridium] fimetarium TaxID=99656 RepID=A0A1I0MDJ9_9FIRM|nr:hypothetical protein [[Clostridium] fimetarium]SEV85806.1 hypothetical protein SAMN05421659_101386 [[Clostridium] fimetarium]
MKINKTLIAIICMMLVLMLLPQTIKAEDSLKLVCKTSSTNVYPGESIDVVVYLDNYASPNIKDITTLQLFINLNSDYYTYVENSLKDLSDAKGNEQIYSLNYVSDKKQIQLQFSDLTKILSRNTKNLYQFKVKINDNLLNGSNFEIGPDVFKCVDGRSAQIYTIPSEITKSNIHVVEKSLSDSKGIESYSDNIINNVISNTVSSSNNSENGSGAINQTDAVNQTGTTVNKSSEAEVSNAIDTDVSATNIDSNENIAQAGNFINAGSVAAVIIISSAIIGLITYYVFNKRRKKNEK